MVVRAAGARFDFPQLAEFARAIAAAVAAGDPEAVALAIASCRSNKSQEPPVATLSLYVITRPRVRCSARVQKR